MDNERFEMKIDDKGMVTEIRHGYEMDVGNDPKAVVNHMTDNPGSKKPKIAWCHKADSFYYTDEQMQEHENLKHFYIEFIEKSAFDELQKERDDLKTHADQLAKALTELHKSVMNWKAWDRLCEACDYGIEGASCTCWDYLDKCEILREIPDECEALAAWAKFREGK